MYNRCLIETGDLRVQVAGSKTYGDTVAVVLDKNQAYVAWFEGRARGFYSPYAAFAIEVIAGLEAENIELVEASSLDELILRVCDVQDVSQLLDRRVRELESEDSARARYALVSSQEFRPIRPEFLDWVQKAQSRIHGWARVLRPANASAEMAEAPPLRRLMGRRVPTRPLEAPLAPRS